LDAAQVSAQGVADPDQNDDHASALHAGDDRAGHPVVDAQVGDLIGRFAGRGSTTRRSSESFAVRIANRLPSTEIAAMNSTNAVAGDA
jgi:hypothetical protein